jgi:glutathione peroxidase
VYTPQEAGLQVLENTFSAQGFHVLGFLSNDFGNQGGTAGQVQACNAKYGITFAQFAEDHVIPVGTAKAQPVFAWLEAQMSPGPDGGSQFPGPDTDPLPTWNFSKYLISRTGVLVAHWDSPQYPGMDPSDPTSMFDTNPIVVAIKAELAK